MNQKYIRCLFAFNFALVTIAGTSYSSHSLAAEQVKNNHPKVSFHSQRLWDSGRWYVIGRFVDVATIAWVDGRKSRVPSFKPECMLSATTNPENFQINLVESTDQLGLEVMRKNAWFAVEVNPLQDEIRVTIGNSAQDSACNKVIALKLAWAGQRLVGEVRPVLFLSPKSQVFSGQEFELVVPDFSNRADIQLELLLAYWSATFPNALAGNSQSISFAPVAVARGEWLMPFHRKLGLSLALDQTINSFGGVADQSVLMSNWSTGVYYQHVVPVVAGWLVRGGLRYRHHLSDDTSATVASVQLDARYLSIEALTALYVGRRWIFGAQVEYAWPQNLAGNGVSQGYFGYLARAGIRPSSVMTVVLETGARTYSSEGYSSESVRQLLQLGIRLDL